MTSISSCTPPLCDLWRHQVSSPILTLELIDSTKQYCNYYSSQLIWFEIDLVLHFLQKLHLSLFFPISKEINYFGFCFVLQINTLNLLITLKEAESILTLTCIFSKQIFNH